MAVILLSNKFKMNPDNLATPLAASIGDVVSISLLSFIASLLFEHLGKLHGSDSGCILILILFILFPSADTHLWITFVVVTCYFILLPFWVFLVFRNKYTRPVLTTGWVPVLSALFISG